MYSKRLISLLTVVALLFSFIAVNGADYDNHWGYEYIENLVRRGIVSGDNNGRINPDNSITRAEFAKIINLFFEYTDYSEVNFPDVSEDMWYAADMAKAKANGYYKGDNNGLGNPDKSLTRNEAAVVFAKLLNLTDTDTAGFNDTVDSWAYQSALALKKKGIMVGDNNGNFNGRSNITRAEAFKMLVTSEVKTPDDTVSTGTLLPATGNTGGGSVSSGGGGGGGGGGSSSGGGNASSNPDITVQFEDDEKTVNVKWEQIQGVSSYSVTVTRLTDNANVSKTESVSGTLFDITSVLNELMTQGGVAKKINEKFNVSVSAGGYSDSLEFEYKNKAVKNPEISVQQSIENGNEEISLNWTVDTNASSYELKIEFGENNFVTIPNTNGKAVIPSEYLSLIKGEHNAKIQGISNDPANVLSTDVIDFKVELPMFAGVQNGINIIKTKRHFMNMSLASTGSYKLGGNIDLGSYEPFAFGGKLDGAGNTINIELNTPSKNDVGLFSYVTGTVEISNLTVTGNVTGAENVGGFAGRGHEISSGAVIKNSVNKANISGTKLVGGFIGESNYNNSSALSFSNLINYGNVTAVNNAAGGIAGLLSKNTVDYCANLGDIEGVQQIGGIVGWSYNNFNGCYNAGNVKASTFAGGIAGQAILDTTSILNCYNTGKIEGTDAVGGIAGSDSSGKIFSYCYNTYPIDMSAGILDNANTNSQLINCYTVEATGTLKDGCSKLTLEQLKLQASFSGFNFSSVWTMAGNIYYEYPELSVLNHIVIPKHLSVPEITTVVNTGSAVLVEFNPVQNATGYTVSISDLSGVIDEETLNSTTYSVLLDKSSLTVGNTYTVTVKAIGKEGIYIDSEKSENYIHTKPALASVSNPQIVYNSSDDSYTLSFTGIDSSYLNGYILSAYEDNNATPVWTSDINTTSINISSSMTEIFNGNYTVKIVAESNSDDYVDSAAVSVSLNTCFAGGEGTEAKPYLIAKERHFKNIAMISDNDGIYYKQIDSFNFTATAQTDLFVFNGNYDGGNNTITLAVSGGWYLALFHKLSGSAVVKNLTLDGTVSSWTDGASLAYEAVEGAIINIENIVNNAEISVGQNAGGIIYISNVGSSGKLVINKCINNGSISTTNNGNASKNLGGIVGSGKAEISLSYNTGNLTTSSSVSTTGSFGVGGIIGANRTSGTVISNCYNTGVLNATGNVGGIIGAAGVSWSTPTIKNCYTTIGLPIGAVMSGGGVTPVNIYYCAASDTDNINNTTALSSSQFTDLTNFTGFSTDIWKDGTNGPVFK